MWGLPKLLHSFILTGAVAQEDIYQPTSHRFVNTGLNCSGMENKLTNCTQNLDEAYSCQSFGTAWVSCQRKLWEILLLQ